MKKDYTIGVLGGMGTYATINLFQQYAELFVAEKEWDRPRMIIDNRCTMPSRVRAFLYDENVEQLVSEMADSIGRLIDAGSSRIILACNTSHLFLPKVYELIPEAKNRVIHIIENCVDIIKKNGETEVYLLGTEGTIDSGIYQQAFESAGIKCIAPEKEEYSMLRECIEAVKQKQYTDEVKRYFLELVNRYPTCILGCTELPLLYERYKSEVTCVNVYDPLYLALLETKKEYDNE